MPQEIRLRVEQNPPPATLTVPSRNPVNLQTEQVRIVGMGIPSGGTEGQMLAKKSDLNYDTEWVDPDVGLPQGGNVGDVLMKTASEGSGASWVTPAQNAEADNTRPITAAAVYTEIGNINALLATI